ncbi:MAG: DNA-binding transcriptional regulator [Lentimonas sp.]
MDTKPHILMMIESSRESGRKLILGIADYARHFGPWHFDWQPQGVRGLTVPMDGQPYDGILVRDLADVRQFVDAGIPTVAFTYGKQRIADTVMVNADDRGIGEAVALHFLQRGFRNFAFCGQANMAASAKRAECYVSTLKASGFDVNQFWTNYRSTGTKKDQREAEAAIEWLRSLPKPVALMTANDDLGQRIVQLCQSGGLRVPDDCAVVGVDNDPVVCGVCDPPLSSIALDQYQAGYRAAAALDRMLRGEAPEAWEITAEVGEVVVRESSDIFAIDDPAVSKALRFIQANAHLPISVDDIAQASGLFRRGLERRFKEHLSQSIQQRCREVQASHLAKLIGESNLSLEAIAEQCGFSEASHLTCFFASVRGETPSAYRKRCSSG